MTPSASPSPSPTPLPTPPPTFPLAVVTGLYLYWRFTDHFDAGIVSSRGGLAFGIGGALAIVSLILGGSVVGRNLKRAGELMEQAISQPDVAARAALMTQAASLRGKAASVGRVVSVMIIITIMLMGLGHYI